MKLCYNQVLGKDFKAAHRTLQAALYKDEIEDLARQVFEEIKPRALDAGVRLPETFLTRLIGELSGLGPLLGLIAHPDVDDVAINLGHIFIYTTASGLEPAGPAPESVGDALRVLMDRACQIICYIYPHTAHGSIPLICSAGKSPTVNFSKTSKH